MRRGDVFKTLRGLILRGDAYPNATDYYALEEDRSYRFAETVADDASNLVELARAEPGVEHHELLGGEAEVCVRVDVFETLEDCYVTARGKTEPPWAKLPLILTAFFPDRVYDDWQMMPEMPGRQLVDTEICHRMQLDHGEA